eukprot:Gb_40783 [translate_table: standard]
MRLDRDAFSKWCFTPTVDLKVWNNVVIVYILSLLCTSSLRRCTQVIVRGVNTTVMLLKSIKSMPGLERQRNFIFLGCTSHSGGCAMCILCKIFLSFPDPGCPDLVLINGEDLTPYRAASKEIMNVLKRFGTVERLGLDECGLDITSETKRCAASGTFPKSFLGLVIGMNLACEVVRDGMEETAIKPTACDLRNSIPCPVSKIESKEIKASACVITSRVENESKNFDVENRNLLMIGSYLAAEIRAAVEKETGFQCSCGISYNVCSLLSF